MHFHKLSTVVLSCIIALTISACDPQAVKPTPDGKSAGDIMDLLDILDPDVTTEEQALTKGVAALKEGKPENALFYFVKTLQFNKQNIEALEHIARIHIRSNRPELAFRVNQEILTLNGKNAFANENIGLYYLDKGQLVKAKDHLSIAAKDEKVSWKADNGLGVIADLKGEHKEAVSYYEAALMKNANSPIIMNNLGYSFYLAGNKSKAKFWFNQALQFDNRFQRAIHNLALIEIKEGNLPTAIALFKRIMPIHETYNNIGYICMLNGQYDLADEYLRRAINESPVYFPKAQENLKALSSVRPN